MLSNRKQRRYQPGTNDEDDFSLTRPGIEPLEPWLTRDLLQVYQFETSRPAPGDIKSQHPPQLARYIQHSHWSSSYIAGLSLGDIFRVVKNIFMVLLRNQSYAIKTQLAQGTFSPKPHTTFFNIAWLCSNMMKIFRHCEALVQ